MITHPQRPVTVTLTRDEFLALCLQTRQTVMDDYVGDIPIAMAIQIANAIFDELERRANQ